MCNRYTPPDEASIEREWHIGSKQPARWWKAIGPRGTGPFIRTAGAGVELVEGTWALVPSYESRRAPPYSTNNARFEEIERKPSFRTAWARGQRCIIPALSFDEPCWESGKNVWWRFQRSDGHPWGLAGLWNTWTDRETGEMFETYTMLTINADSCPMMSRMHRPGKEKRSVVPIALQDVDEWLRGSQFEAKRLMHLAPAEVFAGAPA